jgi:DNA-directed DNA polymerase III PolC
MNTFLGAHSEFSLLNGVGAVSAWVKQAKALGYTSLGLADVNRMSGLVMFWQECERQGIRPVMGVELREAAPHKEGSATVYARGDAGYGDLCELITWRQTGLPRTTPFSLKAAFAEAWPELFILSSHLPTLEALARGPNRDRVYGALVRHDAATRAHGRALAAWCDREGIPMAACGDAWFPTAAGHELHRVLRATDLNSTLSRLRAGETAPPEAWLHPPARMLELFEDRPDCLENAERIAAACAARPPMNGWVMPIVDVPAGETPESRLTALAREGLMRHYGGTRDFARAEEIQEMELGVIKKLGYASYFLMVKDVYEEAGKIFSHEFRRPKDCSLLRGSAANSLTFYNLGVGRLDPIEHNLYFQRFLNEDRASPPDADLDFGWDEREKILEHVVKRYGRERVAITCTFQHFRFKAAFREAAKVFGYSEDQVTEILGARDSRERRRSDESIRGVEVWAKRLLGRPRFLGQHPGGLIITNQPIWRHVGCEWSRAASLEADGSSGAPGDPGTRRLITQIDMHSGIDELGLIKFDLLGNGSLSVLRDALDQIRRQKLPDPEVWDLPKCYADPAANRLMRSGNLRGVFYLESPAQTRLNKKADVETFDEVIVTSSLIRPAGTAYAKTYVERHRKAKMNPPVKDWEFLHPSLIPILGDTHDVCAFQEDVTKICHEVAGLSFKRADAVRKQMNSQHDGPLSTPALRELAEEFVTGCMFHRGLSRAEGEELWGRVASFTGFSFCKSHSASYAQLSYQCVWLKAHFPAEFLSSVISNNHGFYRRVVYLNEARRLGITLQPVDVNRSCLKYEGAGRFIRPGLLHLRQVSAGTVRALEVARDPERGGGPFRDLEDFLRRVPAGLKETENLVLAGAFDGFGLTQPELLFHLDGIYRGVSCRGEAAASLFGEEANGYRARDLHPGLRDYSLMQRCLNEERLFGYMLSGNPLDVLDVHPAARDAVPAAELGQHAGRRVKVLGLYVTGRTHRVAKSGRLMEFLTLEDRSGTVDVIFWPDMLDRWEETLLEAGPFEVWGKVTEEWDTYSLEAEHVRPVEFRPNLVDFDLASARLRAGVSAADPAAPEKVRIHVA